ncbi:MAG: hypothetical protein ABI400_07445 [Lacisediminihabitans sp.]
MITNLAMMAASAGHVLAASGSDGDSSNFGLLFLASGFVFYGLMYLRYRNADKRQRYESETEATLHNMQAEDQFVRSMKGLSNSRMANANNTEVRGVRRKFF